MGIVALAALAAVAEAAPVAHTSSTVVLGSKAYAPQGYGWGTVSPDRIYNGGVPSGLVTDVVWQDWGQPVATGQGLTWVYMPKGGYYPEQGAIQLRAQGIGRCRRKNGRPEKHLAYRRLFASVVDYPGGPFGPWFRWSGTKSICRWKF
jgi:hypothetical protein